MEANEPVDPLQPWDWDRENTLDSRIPEIDLAVHNLSAQRVLELLNEEGITLETTVERQEEERARDRWRYRAMVLAVGIGVPSAVIFGASDLGSPDSPATLLDWAAPIVSLIAVSVSYLVSRDDRATAKEPSRAAVAAREAWASAVASKREVR